MADIIVEVTTTTPPPPPPCPLVTSWWKDPIRRLFGWPLEQELKEKEWIKRGELIQVVIQQLNRLIILTSLLCYTSDSVRDEVVREVTIRLTAISQDLTSFYSIPFEQLRDYNTLDQWFQALRAYQEKWYDSHPHPDWPTDTNHPTSGLVFLGASEWSATSHSLSPLMYFDWKFDPAEGQDAFYPLAQSHGIKLWKDEVVHTGPVSETPLTWKDSWAAKQASDGLQKFDSAIEACDSSHIEQFFDELSDRLEAHGLILVGMDTFSDSFAFTVIPQTNLTVAMPVIQQFNANFIHPYTGAAGGFPAIAPWREVNPFTWREMKKKMNK